MLGEECTINSPGGITSYQKTSEEELVWSETRAKRITKPPLVDCEQRFSDFKEEG